MVTFPVALQVKLESLVQEVVRQMLTTSPALHTAPLDEIEKAVRAAGQQVQERLTEELIQASAAQVETEWPRCVVCAERLRAKVKRTRRLVTDTGEVSLTRDYYACPAGHGGSFPVDQRWQLSGHAYSPARAAAMVWLSSLLPYAEAQEVFRRIGHWSVGTTSLWNETHYWGMKAHTDHQRQVDQVSVERVVLPPAGQDTPQPQGVSMDGGMVHIRGEGWKEFKAGVIYDVVPEETEDPVTGDRVELAGGQRLDYVAVLGEPQSFGKAFWALAVQRGFPRTAKTSVTADGAEWIWNLAADYFPDSTQIVDGYHGTEHVAQAAMALSPQNVPAAQAWQALWRNALYLGEVDRIIAPLDQAGLNSESHYFHHHARRMQYQTFREEGYPIGSGSVESGIKQFKRRLTGAGMRWSRPGAEQMLVLRSAAMSGTFDTLWQNCLN